MMQAQSKQAGETAPASYVAVVLECSDEYVLIAPAGRPATPVRARCALSADQELVAGDEVVALACDGATIVIASLARRPGTLRLADGSVAALSEDGASIELRRGDGTALFRYETGATGTRLVVESDGVALRSARGDLELSAAAAVVVHGQRVTVRSDAQDAARVQLGPEGMALRGRRLELHAEHYDQRSGSATLRSGELRAEVGQLHATLERIETVATQVVQHARNVYQRVEELAQTRAGRLRMLVDGTLQVRAQRAITRTDEQYKVRAETIHLG